MGANEKFLKPPQFWSVSRYNTWSQCAYKYQLQHMLKIPTPEAYPMQRGIRIHKLLEEYLKGNVTGIPDELEHFKKELIRLKRLKVDPEVSWTITKDLEITHAKDWDNAWLRAKIDAHHYFDDNQELIIIDLKTGKVRPSIPQMDLYAWMSKFFYPNAKKIIVELWFSDHGDVLDQVYTQSDIKRIGKRWIKRAEKMLSDREFPAMPGHYCNWCAYRSSQKLPNGEFGPCQKWKMIT